MAALLTKLIVRNDTSTNWTAQNPVLLKGEIGIEWTTTNVSVNNKNTSDTSDDTVSSPVCKFKIGDGTTAWTSLQYYGGTFSITGTGNTIVDASYSASTGTLTLTKGDRVASVAATAGNTGVVVSKTGTTAVSITVSHATSGANATKGPSANVTIGTAGTTATIVVPKLTADSYGHVTSLSEQTLTIHLPSLSELGIAGAYVYKGSCTWAQLIAKTNQEVGWVWSITDEDPNGNVGQNWACKTKVGGTAPGSSYATYWDNLGGTVNLTNYATLDGNNHFTGANTIDSLVAGNLVVTGGAQFNGSLVGNLTGNADSATTAANAVHAGSAGYATEAAHSASATYANSANSAAHATHAGSAGYASSAGSATSASEATHAASAAYAVSSNCAAHAKHAGSAGYATSASEATHAASAAYAASSNCAAHATHAGSAGYATSAANATYAAGAGTATYASSASWANSANTANYAGTAAYARNSDQLDGQDGSYYLDTFNHTPHFSKTYSSTSYYATTGSWDASTWYFARIIPTERYKPWRIKYRITTTCDANNSYRSETWATVTGCGTTTESWYGNCVFANFNNYLNHCHYYTVLRALTLAGFNSGLGHALGISILYSSNYTSSSYPRTFKVEIFEYENCTVTIPDTTLPKWGTGDLTSTNYGSIYDMNAISRGLQETGDNDSGNYNIRYYYSRFVRGNQLNRYQICPTDGKYIYSICNTDNNTGQSKTSFYTGEFDPTGPILYNDYGGSEAAGGYRDGCLYQQILVDMRYTFNNWNATAASSDFAAGDAVYLVTVPQSNGKVKLYFGASGTDYKAMLSKTLPTTDNGLVYIYLGQAYDQYRMMLILEHPCFWYKDGAVRPYLGNNYVANGSNASLASLATDSATIGNIAVTGSANFTNIINGSIVYANSAGYAASAGRINLTSTDNNVPRFDGTAGNLQSSKWYISDTGALNISDGTNTKNGLIDFKNYTTYGIDTKICSGALMVIGAGESGDSAFADSSNVTGESLWLTADTGVYIASNGDTWANRQVTSYSAAGNWSMPHGLTVGTTTANNNNTTTINGKMIINPSYNTAANDYNEGIRINAASNGWAEVIFGGSAGSSSGIGSTIWLVGKRGHAGSIAGAAGDFSIEDNNSSGVGLTIHQNSGGATLNGKMKSHGFTMSVTGSTATARATMQYNSTDDCIEFVFS